MDYSRYIHNYVIPKIPGRFGSEGEEWIGESPFQEDDYKMHFSINVHTGLWQDFKLDKKGNLFQLVAHLHNTTYQSARQMVLFNSIGQMGQLEFWVNKKPELVISKSIEGILEESKAEIVTEDFLDCEGTKFNTIGFLLERKIFNLTTFYFGNEGPLKDRLIIPYIQDNKVYSYQARSMDPELMPKYLIPPSTTGIQKSKILYPYENNKEHLLITEGIIDVLSLKAHAVNATCVTGTSISSDQMNLLKTFNGEVILGFNNDNPDLYKDHTSPGLKATRKFLEMAIRKCFDKNISYVFPPDPYKDWNDMHIANKDLKEYIRDNKKEVTFLTLQELYRSNGSTR